MLRNPLSTLVVADPDIAYQRQIISLLESSFRCFPASSLREAYQTIVRERPSLITLELTQPDGDGIGFIQYLQAEPSLQHILIACVTERSSIADKVRAFRAGADDYFVKPIYGPSFYGQMLLLRRTGHMARNFTKK
ncbi:MAG TPA: response regulator [Ktedonobacterales bacterium]|nr:response regulator [Ktedonobacterales bacterium]